MDWQSLGNIAFYWAAGATVLFAALYMVIAPWWRSETGRNIMAVMGALAIAFAYFGWVVAIGGVPSGFYPIRAILFMGLASAIT